MYTLKSWDGMNGMTYSGTLVQCLKLGRRNWQRLGIPGDVYRPDGTSIRAMSERPIWTLP